VLVYTTTFFPCGEHSAFDRRIIERIGEVYMRFRISRGILVSACTLWLVLISSAQQGNTSSGNTSGGTSPASGGGSTRNTPSSSTCSGVNCPGNQSPLNRGPIFITGKVVLGDGTPPAESVRIERVCNGTVRTEGQTDHKGNFSIELGRSFQFQDASMSGLSSDPFSGGGQDPFQTGRGSGGIGGQGGISERDLWGCELRAALPGYRSDVVSLAGRRAMDDPQIGTIVLRRLGRNTDGLTVSATAALAPKDAKKAFEKAMDAVKKSNPDEAQAQLEKAVATYPRYAVAWLELGKIHEQRDRTEEARKAYGQSVAADSKFMPPYERLAAMALKSADWQKLIDLTDRMIKLDPFTSLDAYYMSSIANLQMKHFDVSEKNAMEAIKLDPLKKNMRAYYILGLAQASQAKFAGAADSLSLVLRASPSGMDMDLVRKQLVQVQEAAKEAVSRTPPQ
jgi:tetratricopeptide (TPR) repeat protein